MSNQTLLQVPTDVGDAETLKRFLDRLVERLDIILGYRGDTAYATEEQLTALQQSSQEQVEVAVALVEDTKLQLSQEILVLLDELAVQLGQIQNLVDRVDQVEIDISDINLELVSIDSRLDKLEESLAYSTTALRDFNSLAWTTGPMYTKFVALGSELTNSPVSTGVDGIVLDDDFGIVTDITSTPYVVNPTTTYKVYIEVRPAYLQRVTIYGPDFYVEKVRAGSTWAELTANAWI